MCKVVAVGGGSIDSMDLFFREVAELSNTPSRPHITVIPTGAGDAEAERASYDLWRERLGSVTESVSPLYLHQGDARQALGVLSDTDAVWVPGGNARLLLSTWRRTGTAKALRKAARRGVVLSGRSAGASCWFSYALAAEPPRRTARFFSYRRNRGLGIVDTTLCPHYQDRREGFRNLLETFNCTGVGLGDATAFVVDDDRYAVITSGKEAGGAYSVWISEKTAFLAERRLPSDGRYRPLSEALHPLGETLIPEATHGG